jgi:hypothetical protein
MERTGKRALTALLMEDSIAVSAGSSSGCASNAHAVIRLLSMYL